MLIQKKELKQCLVRRAPPQIVQQMVKHTVVEAFSFRGCMQLLQCETWVIPRLRLWLTPRHLGAEESLLLPVYFALHNDAVTM